MCNGRIDILKMKPDVYMSYALCTFCGEMCTRGEMLRYCIRNVPGEMMYTI